MHNFRILIPALVFVALSIVLFAFKLVDPLSVMLGAGATLTVYGLVLLVQQIFHKPTKLTEETPETQAIIKGWYEQAKTVTATTLPGFIRHLLQAYHHDYGTICHAMAAASLAAVHAIDADEKQGGITGFQAGTVMWQFIQHWTNLQGPARMLRYEDLLYPQYVPHFQGVIHEDVARYLKEQAQEKLKGEMCSCCPEVKAHWEMLAEGKLPEGLRVENF